MNENEAYHKDTSRISKSGLDLIRKAPKLYWSKYLDENNSFNNERIEAFILGTAFHSFCLEPEKIHSELVVMPNFYGSGSRLKTKEFKSIHSEKTIVSLDLFKQVEGMIQSVNEHPIACKLLSDGYAEKQFNWIDSDTGAKCKCKPDWYNDNYNFAVDLKSTEDASEEGFSRSAKKFRYYVQAPYYFDGLVENSIPVEKFVFIAVEKKPPFLVNIFFYNQEDMEFGREEYKEDLKIYQKCKTSNEWHGYNEKIKPLYLHK